MAAAAMTAGAAAAAATGAAPARRVTPPAAIGRAPAAEHGQQAAEPSDGEPPGARPTRPYRRHRPHALFGIHVGQIITLQVIVLTVVLAVQQPPWAFRAVLGVALVLLILIMVPFRGRWLFQWLALWIRYAARHRRVPVPESDEAAVGVLLRMVTRGGHLASADMDGTEVTFIRHAGGMTAVLEPTPTDVSLIRNSSDAFLPLSELLPAPDEGELTVAAQVVLHSVPAPTTPAGSSAAAISYRWLSDGMVPCRRRCWVALQVLRTADDHSDDVVSDALVSAVRRLQRKLRRAGMVGHVLGHDEVVSILLPLVRPDAVRSAVHAGNLTVRERWRSWHVGDQLHTTFRVCEWPDLSGPETHDFLDRLSGVPAQATAVAVAVRRDGAELELEAAVLMTLPDEAAIRHGTRQLEEVAGEVGARVQRLDGEQVYGVAGALPLGGFLP